MVQPHEKAVLVAVPKELAKAFKLECVRRELTIKGVIAQSILNFMAESATPQREANRQQQPEA